MRCRKRNPVRAAVRGILPAAEWPAAPAGDDDIDGDAGHIVKALPKTAETRSPPGSCVGFDIVESASTRVKLAIAGDSQVGACLTRLNGIDTVADAKLNADAGRWSSSPSDLGKM
jgi:hypothetical protein